ncbi:MAG: alpha/beta hydrolase [Bdellovibrionota bacterium]
MILHFNRWPVNRLPEDHSKNSPEAKIILLHGLGGLGYLWRPIAVELENRFEILAPDQRGHGRSRIPHTSTSTGYSPLEYGGDIIDTMDATAFHPAWLVGHSMGVRSACAAAKLGGNLISGLILIDLDLSPPDDAAINEVLELLRNLPTKFESKKAARSFLLSHCSDPSIARYLIATLFLNNRELKNDALSFNFDRSALIETVLATKNISLLEWLDEIQDKGPLPTLILRGADSKVWDHESFEKDRSALARHHAIEFKEVEGAGHGLPFEKRTQFIQILTDFISRA